MNVKIDTKEKFTVITPYEEQLTANMTDELKDLLLPFVQKGKTPIVINLREVKELDEAIGRAILIIHQQFYKNNTSFVVCNIQPMVKKLLEEKELLEFLNHTPTESEAWDILQMEEIERELLGGE